jgi:hypothetical protein
MDIVCDRNLKDRCGTQRRDVGSSVSASATSHAASASTDRAIFTSCKLSVAHGVAASRRMLNGGLLRSTCESATNVNSHLPSAILSAVEWSVVFTAVAFLSRIECTPDSTIIGDIMSSTSPIIPASPVAALKCVPASRAPDANTVADGSLFVGGEQPEGCRFPAPRGVLR